jgi:hypothetical protein
MNEPLMFKDTDERLDALGPINRLHWANRTLAALPDVPDLARYRVGVPADSVALPSPVELAQARDVLRRVASCYGDLYNRRLRPGDYPFNFASLDDPDPTRQDNDPPF